MIDKKDLTIIIPTMAKERNEYALNECLVSLEESGFPMKSVLVVYNGEFGFDPKFAKPRLMWVEDQGQCKAVNAGVATVSTKWIMVSNDDMVYPPDWFEKLGKGVFYDSDSSLVDVPFSLSPILIEPTVGAPTFKKVFFGGVGGDWNKQGFMEYATNHNGGGVRSGFNLPLMMRKQDWDLVGGYDVRYDPWGSNSDSDLEYKLKLAGIKMLQNTYCPVYHFSNTSNTFHPENRSHWQKNWDYFIEKWGFPRTDDGIWQATFEIPYENLKFKPHWAKIPGERR